jgi:hypothetical protein
MSQRHNFKSRGPHEGKIFGTRHPRHLLFVGNELDDQRHPNINGIINVDGQRRTKHLVTKHVERAMTMEVHTTDTSN